MIRRLPVALACLICTIGSSKVLAMRAEYGPGKIARESHPEWPKGLVELINSHDRMWGYWINQIDFFFYRGDCDALNEFLASYGNLPDTPLSVVLHAGVQPLTGPLGKEKNFPYNWELTVKRRGWGTPLDPQRKREDPGYVVTMEVWLGDAITLNRIEIPSGVDVKSAGEIDRFIDGHRVESDK